MKSAIVSILFASAIPLVWGLGISGVLALTGIWKRANATAKLGVFANASDVLETAVETSVHSLDADEKPFLLKVQSGQMTLPQFGQAILSDLKTQGSNVMVPALAKALGVTVQGLEDLALSKALKKTGLTVVPAPSGLAMSVAAVTAQAPAPAVAHP